MKKMIKAMACIIVAGMCTIVMGNGLTVKAAGNITTMALESNSSDTNGAPVEILGKKYDYTTTVLNLNNATVADYELFKSQIANLPYLTRVELKGSNLNDAQMMELSDTYPNIRFIWTFKLGNYWTLSTDQVAFSCNKGGGPSLTNADIKILNYCKDMVALDLGHNSFTDLSFVRNMPNLRILIISDGRVSDLTPLKDCKNLVYFEAWFTRISDLSPLQYLVNLKDINVAHNRNCNNITPLLHLPKLERIYMSYCNVSQDSINLLRATYPNARIEMVEYYADRAGWRTHERYYAMRRMYKANALSPEFFDDTDKLAYFSKVFDVNYYAQNYPEVVEKVGTNPEDLLYYFLNTGINEYQVASPNFNVINYAKAHPELKAVFGGDGGAYLREYLYSDDVTVY